MALFRKKKNDDNDDGGTGSSSPLVTTLCARLGVRYGGWDTIAPLLGPEQGMSIVFHIDDGTPIEREPFLKGTGVTREARAYRNRVEVWDGEALLATYDDLSVADVFAS